MGPIAHFIPGEQAKEESIFARWRVPIAGGVTQAYLQAYTEPGEIVLAPYCQGPAVVREILTTNRKALALNFDPTLVLVVRTILNPPPERDLNAALARLGDGLKQDVPLRRHLERLYTTTCPACLRTATADYFIWDRDQEVPIAKHLHCLACAWDGQAAVEPEDLARLADVPARGMHYHYILDRVVPDPQVGSLRPRLEPLLKLYSSRNLYVLAELTLKIESLFPEGQIHHALKLMLLDCLDRCSSLTPLPGRAVRQRTLARPGRFLERNVWLAFQEAASRVRAEANGAVSSLADSPEALLGQASGWTGFVGQGLIRDLQQIVPPRSIGLILASPPPLDSSIWSLSYLWGAWLLGADAVAGLRPLLRQRTPDPSWYSRVMARSFRTLAGLLRDNGHLVLILTEQRPAVVESLVLAATIARLGTASLVQSGPDYRLELTPTFPQPLATPHLPRETGIQQASREAAMETIRARGEPVSWRTLHAAIQVRLAKTGPLLRELEREGEGLSPLVQVADQVQAGLDNPSLVRLAGTPANQELWWLARPSDVAPPLCDRVEIAAFEVLHNGQGMTELEFARAVYACFPGVLTPEPALVAISLRAFGQEVAPNCWRLRQEDLPSAREAEGVAIIENLLALGHRLGHRSVPFPPFDVAWFEGQKARAVFVVRWRAAVDEALGYSNRIDGAIPYLVIPGGRASLVSYKLGSNPLWQQVVDDHGWMFIKYRHVRQLVAQPEVDEYSLRTIVGLDPIIERETAQLTLF